MKKRITVELMDDEFAELNKLKETMDRSLAWIGRQAINEFLARNKPLLVPTELQHSLEEKS